MDNRVTEHLLPPRQSHPRLGLPDIHIVRSNHDLVPKEQGSFVSVRWVMWRRSGYVRDTEVAVTPIWTLEIDHWVSDPMYCRRQSTVGDLSLALMTKWRKCGLIFMAFGSEIRWRSKWRPEAMSLRDKGSRSMTYNLRKPIQFALLWQIDHRSW